MNAEVKQWFTVINKCMVREIYVDVLPKGAIFGFTFPNKFSEQEAWVNRTASSQSTAYFFEDNVAKLLLKGSTEQKEVTWLIAYNHIACSTYGIKVLPLPVEVGMVLPSLGKVTDIIKSWLSALNTIPLIKASLADDKAGDLIKVSIPASFKEALNVSEKQSLGESEACLTDDGTVIWTFSDNDEKTPRILENYLKIYDTWQDFYTALCKYLQELCNSVPDFHPQEGVITEVAGFHQKMETYNQRLNEWVDAFNKIPGVKAKVYDDENPNYLIEIDVPINAGFVNSSDSSFCEAAYFYLCVDGSIHECQGFNGTPDAVYESWSIDPKGGWEYFYNQVVLLVQKFIQSVPAAPVS